MTIVLDIPLAKIENYEKSEVRILSKRNIIMNSVNLIHEFKEKNVTRVQISLFYH